MTMWGQVFLGVIAVASLASAVVQIGMFIAAGRLARRMEHLLRGFEHELKPFFGHMNAIGRDASRTASLATAQVERVDRVFADLVERVDQSLNLVQATVTAPVREGAAIMAGARAMFNSLRDLRGRGRGDDEDVLFI